MGSAQAQKLGEFVESELFRLNPELHDGLSSLAGYASHQSDPEDALHSGKVALGAILRGLLAHHAQLVQNEPGNSETQECVRAALEQAERAAVDWQMQVY